jgi:hypothetical protein
MHLVFCNALGPESFGPKTLKQYSDLFQTPTSSPPSRIFDHVISLNLGTVLVNSKPYRYSHQQKNKIERQVTTMIKAGTMVPSLSSFASPVLLVKKEMAHEGSV